MSDTGKRTFACPECGHRFYWRQGNVGSDLRCHICGLRVVVPPEPIEGLPPASEPQAPAPPPSSPAAPPAEGYVPLGEPELVIGSPRLGEVVSAFLIAHWGKTAAGLLAALLAVLWCGWVAPIRGALAEAQAALRRDTRIGDLTLAIPLFPLRMPSRVAASGTTAVTYSPSGTVYKASPPYHVTLTPGTFFCDFGTKWGVPAGTPLSVSLVFRGRVSGEYCPATRELTLDGALEAMGVAGTMGFSLTTATPDS